MAPSAAIAAASCLVRALARSCCCCCVFIEWCVAGIAHLRPKEYRTISKRQKVVSRAYGGNRCHTCVRDRVVRAFLVEERKIVKNVLKQKLAQRAATQQEK